MAPIDRRFMLALLAAVPMVCMAGEAEDAQAAVERIRRSISDQNFERLYDDQTSEFFKAGIRRAEFLQNMKQGRAQVGATKSINAMSHSYSEIDPQTGYRGKIYAFDFLVKYDKGAFFERLVLVKDPDGRYRLAGIRANPAPN